MDTSVSFLERCRHNTFNFIVHVMCEIVYKAHFHGFNNKFHFQLRQFLFFLGSLFTSLRSSDSQTKDSVFCLLLKRAKSILLEPGATLDIPISFAPDNMQLHEATVTVTVHRDTEDTWDGNYPSMMSTRMVNDLHWIYPVRGIPESHPIKDSQAPCIECKARSRVEERVEVTLTGLAPNTSGSGFGRYPSVTPINLLGRHMPGEMEYGVDYLNVPEEFR